MENKGYNIIQELLKREVQYRSAAFYTELAQTYQTKKINLEIFVTQLNTKNNYLLNLAIMTESCRSMCGEFKNFPYPNNYHFLEQELINNGEQTLAYDIVFNFCFSNGV